MQCCRMFSKNVTSKFLKFIWEINLIQVFPWTLWADDLIQFTSTNYASFELRQKSQKPCLLMLQGNPILDISFRLLDILIIAGFSMREQVITILFKCPLLCYSNTFWKDIFGIQKHHQNELGAMRNHVAKCFPKNIPSKLLKFLLEFYLIQVFPST